MSKAALWRKIRENQGFAFDFECVDEGGEPTKNVLEARPTLLSVATGKHTAYVETYDWDEDTQKFLRYLLSRENMTAVAHYGFYDYAVAHWAGCINIREIKATMMDTYLLAWLLNEEDDLGLKEQVFQRLGYRMTTFGAAHKSPFYRRALELEKSKKVARKDTTASIREMIKNAKRQLQVEKKAIRANIKGRAMQQQEIEKREEMIKWELARHIESEAEGLDQRLEEIQARADEQRAIGDLEFRKYAADDAKQTWRLFKHLMSEVRHLGIDTWLPIELENYRQAIVMHVNGTYIDCSVGQRLIDTTRPLVAEFKAEIFNLAKQGFNLNSPEQVARVLYNDLGIEPPPGTTRLGYDKLKDMPWAYSVDTEAMERIGHPIGQSILNFKTIDTLDKNFLTGLPEQAREDPTGRSRAHVIFNSVGTVTGRWSSSTKTRG